MNQGETPSQNNGQARKSATALKNVGADLRPKGRVWSTNVLPCQRIPSNDWSSGCTGTNWYAFERSILTNSLAWPSRIIMSTASSTEAYCREQISDDMPLFTLKLRGEDRSTISRNFWVGFWHKADRASVNVGSEWRRHWTNDPTEPWFLL